MGAYFPHPTHIPNSLMTHGSPDPWECDNFSYVHFAIPCPHTCIVKYYTNGAQPLALTIDPGTGEIKGNVLPFCKQPCAKNKYPLECITRHGSNFRHSGRFKPSFKDFWFVVYADYLEDLWHPPVYYTVSVSYVDGEGNIGYRSETRVTPGWWEKCVIKGTISKCVFIRVLTNYSINNSLWWNLYTKNCNWVVGDFVFTVSPMRHCCDYIIK